MDLFAGIGQFAIPMAVHGRAARVVACEVNPVASRVPEGERPPEPCVVRGAAPRDRRQIAPEGVEDRIVIGYLHAESYLDVAMRAAKDACVLHSHENVPVEDEDRPRRRVTKAAEASGFGAIVLAVRRIKSFAPRIRHVVLDVRLSSTPHPQSDRPIR